MEQVWKAVEDLRQRYPLLAEDRVPIDVFSFFELDLGLDAIPFPALTARYRVEAAITADFTGIYLDEEQYALMEKGPEWKLNRLRFTVAHELAHFFLHRDLAQSENFASLPTFARWTADYAGRKFKVEQEANEFAGRLLVPETRLRMFFEEFAAPAEKLFGNFMQNGTIRDQFAEKIAPRFGVNAQVVQVRLDRDEIWPVA